LLKPSINNGGTFRERAPSIERRDHKKQMKEYREELRSLTLNRKTSFWLSKMNNELTEGEKYQRTHR